MSTKVADARKITQDFDKLATLVQTEFASLGIPEKIAMDFAYRCDLLSDAIEKQAGFDAGSIAEDVGGPLKAEGDEPYMQGEFSQQEYHELADKQQSGSLGKMGASLAKLAKLSLASSRDELVGLQDTLKSHIAALTDNSSLTEDLNRQVVALEKVSDALTAMHETGKGDPKLLIAADNARQAVGEVLPALDSVSKLSSEEASSLSKIVALAARIVEDAARSV